MVFSLKNVRKLICNVTTTPVGFRNPTFLLTSLTLLSISPATEEKPKQEI